MITNKIFDNIDNCRYANKSNIVVWKDPIIVYRILVDDLNNRYVNLLDGQNTIISITIDDYVDFDKNILCQEINNYFLKK